MNLSNSGCSSGCESGWTMYFDQYSDSKQDEYNRIDDKEDTLRSRGEYINDEEDEDLSMVSDASSAPPHLHEDDNCFVRNQYISCITNQTDGNQKKHKGGKGEEEKSYLDDTASSPLGDFSKEKSTFNKHFSFFKTSVKGKGASKKPGGEQGKKR